MVAVALLSLVLSACAREGSDPGTPTPTVSPSGSAGTTATPRPAFTPTPTVTSVPTATPTATPTAPAAEGWDAFEASLRSTVDAYGIPGRYAVAVTDLQTGYTVSANGDQPQLTGCIVNFFVLLSALLDVRDGLYGAEIVDDLIAATIWSSNAQTAFTLYEITGLGSVQAGVEKVQTVIEGLGLEATTLDHPPAFGGAEDLTYEVDAEDGDGALLEGTGDGNNWTTALDANAALRALYEGKAIEEPWRSQLLEQMTQVKDGLNYLVAWVPYGTVSHKNGFFPNTDTTWVDNDFGIVQVERDGKQWAYAISFFSDSVPYKYGDIPLGQALSSLAFEYFEATYGP
ncbi:MAG: serine hydrolase [Dehalococcoidia bacterium]